MLPSSCGRPHVSHKGMAHWAHCPVAGIWEWRPHFTSASDSSLMVDEIEVLGGGARSDVDDPEQQRNDAYHKCPVCFPRAQKHGILFDELFGSNGLADGHGSQDDSETKEPNEGELQCFASLLAWAHQGFHRGDATIEREDLAGSAVVLPSKLDQTVVAKCLSTAGTRSHGLSLGMILTGHTSV